MPEIRSRGRWNLGGHAAVDTLWLRQQRTIAHSSASGLNTTASADGIVLSAQCVCYVPFNKKKTCFVAIGADDDRASLDISTFYMHV